MVNVDPPDRIVEAIVFFYDTGVVGVNRFVERVLASDPLVANCPRDRTIRPR